MRERISKTISKLILSTDIEGGDPFYATILLTLKIEERESVKSMGTDGIHLFYNKNWVKSLSERDLIFIIKHEALHVALLHQLRIQDRDHHLFNIAADHAVNNILADKHDVPINAIMNSRYKGWSVEEIYAELFERQEEDKMKGRKAQEKIPLPPGEVLAPSLEPEEEDEMKATISSALEQAKEMGDIPLQVKREVMDSLLKPNVSWKDVLSRFLTENSRNDYEWKYPNKRYAWNKVYLPRLNQPELGKIIVAVDTSGSVDKDELNRFLTELRAILSAYPTTIITVIYCDYYVKSVQDVSIENLEVDPIGGGGTSYAPVFEWIEKFEVDPVCLIYFTDGYCDIFGKTEPEYNVLWMLPGGSYNHYFKVPTGFGEVIIMDKE